MFKKSKNELKPGFPDSMGVRTPGTSRAVPCRAMIWWIRAVPNISVPCPHDPCPDLASRNMGPFFCGKKEAPAATYPQVRGFQKYGALFCGRKKTPAATYPQVKGFQKYETLFCGETKRLRQRTHKLRASRNMGVIFLRKK